MDPKLEPNPDNPDGGDKATVPLAALEAERQKRQAAETEAAELRGRVGGLETVGARPATPEPATPKKDLTRAELRKAVEDEKITQEEADDIYDGQTEKRITANATAAATSAVSSANLGGKIESQITQYQAAVPDLADKKSAAYAKVQKEFDALTDLGYDRNDLRTEVVALRNAFGSLEALKETGLPGERRTFEETGGAGDGDSGGDRQDGFPKGFPAHLQSHYNKQFEQGLYKGKDDPAFKAEMDGWKARNARKRAA